MDGRMVRGLSAGGAVRVVEADVLGPAIHTAAIHGLAPSAARLAAEGIAAATVLGATLKGEDRLTLQLQAEEPEVGLYVEVRGDGTLRARMTPRSVPGGTDRLAGLVLLIRSNATGEVYRGMTAVQGESLTRALGRHLAESDQVDARLSVDVETRDGECLSARARLVERLPEASDRPSVSAEEFAMGQDYPMEVVLDESVVVWRCNCSSGRVAAMLALLPPDELDAMIREDHGAEVTCHFCETTWRFGESELRALQAGEVDVGGLGRPE